MSVNFSKRRVLLYGALLALVFLNFKNTVQAEDRSGAELFKVCAVCHGETGEGKKVIGAPRIAGQYEWYIKRQLKHFREGVRGDIQEEHYGHIMSNVAQLLKSDEDINILADYVAKLKVRKKAPCTLNGNLEHGKALYAACAPCHKSNAEGSRAMNTPILRFQHDWYIYRTLKNFKGEHRGDNPKDFTGKQMVSVASSLKNDQDMIDLATYICSLN